MDWPVKSTVNATAFDIPDAANYPNIRLAQVCQGASGNGHSFLCKPSGRIPWNSTSPQSSVPFNLLDRKNPWSVVSPHVIPGFSAACYYTARSLHQMMLSHFPELSSSPPPIGLVQNSLSGSCVEAWTSPTGIAACNVSVDKTPHRCPGAGPQRTCSGCYNGQLAPLAPLRIDAALWWQGECNSGDPKSYACRFPAMVCCLGG